MEAESTPVVETVSSLLHIESREVTCVMLPGLLTGRREGVWGEGGGSVPELGRGREVLGCSEIFVSCPLSSASSWRTERAREDILAREASMSRLLSL